MRGGGRIESELCGHHVEVCTDVVAGTQAYGSRDLMPTMKLVAWNRISISYENAYS